MPLCHLLLWYTEDLGPVLDGVSGCNFGRKRREVRDQDLKDENFLRTMAENQGSIKSRAETMEGMCRKERQFPQKVMFAEWQPV